MSFSSELRDEFGEIDIYLFDQLLKGRFDSRRTILDAGCGIGRNIRWFIRHGFAVHGIDADAAAIGRLRKIAAELAPSLPPAHFIAGDLSILPWRDRTMDAVISSAVLHFARDDTHFADMLQELWRVLRSGGLLFARLASTIGLETRVRWLNGRRARLPDGSERFLVDEPFLLDWTDQLGARLLEPIKTTNVQNQRCMTTWVIGKD
ncbi:MAG TPA: class I SAM-dependent methyltransferase [Vicinamibacterales bacterium]|nr:class I SAM-dependent methyltransferase [Vicinamibacterales bacterium]